MGVTLYEMVTGRVPFKGDSYYAILKAHLESKPIPPIDLVPDAPAELSTIIEKALEKKTTARFQTADEFRAALLALNIPKTETDPIPSLLPPSQSSGNSLRIKRRLREDRNRGIPRCSKLPGKTLRSTLGQWQR